MAIERSRDREQQISYEKGSGHSEFIALKSESHKFCNQQHYFCNRQRGRDRREWETGEDGIEKEEIRGK